VAAEEPVVTAPIIGPRTVEQLDGALHALEIALSPDVMARLDQIFPARRRRAGGVRLVAARANHDRQRSEQQLSGLDWSRTKVRMSGAQALDMRTFVRTPVKLSTAGRTREPGS